MHLFTGPITCLFKSLHKKINLYSVTSLQQFSTSSLLPPHITDANFHISTLRTLKHKNRHNVLKQTTCHFKHENET